MGEVKNITKASLQVRSQDANNNTSNKSYDILSEKGVYDSSVQNGDTKVVSDLVTVMYGLSTRTIIQAVIIGTSNDVMVYGG